MKLPMELESYPPFEGFPPEGLKFLKSLKRNNTREWFGQHKNEYEESVKVPMLSLIAALKEPMGTLVPELEFNPRRNIFRIYRDTRFSKDKTPYKTHVAAVFHRKGHWQESAGFYLHIEPGEIYLGGGIYMPDGTQLKRIRQAVASHAKEFLSIVKDPGFRRRFGAIEGESLQRNPAGYAPDDPMIQWLKLKQFIISAKLEEKRCLNAKFVGNVVDVFKDGIPFVRFLNAALVRS